MIFDVIVAAIIILTMVSGFRRGFIYTFSHTLGWIGAMIAAFFLASPLRTLLSEKTGLDDHIYTAFLNKFSFSSDALSSSSDTFPLIMGQITETAENAAEALSERLTELTMLLLCFFLILIAVKIILFFLTIGLSKRRAKGFTGFLDSGRFSKRRSICLFIFGFASADSESGFSYQYGTDSLRSGRILFHANTL